MLRTARCYLPLVTAMLTAACAVNQNSRGLTPEEAEVETASDAYEAVAYTALVEGGTGMARAVKKGITLQDANNEVMSPFFLAVGLLMLIAQPSDSVWAQRLAWEREWQDILARDTAWSDRLVQEELAPTRTETVYDAISSIRPLWLRYAARGRPSRPACLGIHVGGRHADGDDSTLTFVHKSNRDYTERGFGYWVNRRLRAIAKDEVTELYFSSALETAVPHWQSLGIADDLASCPLIQVVYG